MTPRTIIYWSFSEIVTSRSEPSAIDYADCLRYLNRMMAKFAASGVDVGYTTVGLDDEITCSTALVLPIVKNLVLTLWPQYNFDPVNPLTKLQAKRGLDTLRNYAIEIINPAQYPSTLPYGSGNYDGAYGDQYYDADTNNGIYIGTEQ